MSFFPTMVTLVWGGAGGATRPPPKVYGHSNTTLEVGQVGEHLTLVSGMPMAAGCEGNLLLEAAGCECCWAFGF